MTDRIASPDASRYRRFFERARTLVISSLDEEGEPFVSSSPFVEFDGDLYIYLSRIAEHHAHLERHPRVHVMAVADESATPNPFARERVRFPCRVEKVASPHRADAVLEQFAERFNPNVVGLLRTLDFSLFMLTPAIGRYVVGFGKAFDTDLTGQTFTHVFMDEPSG